LHARRVPRRRPGRAPGRGPRRLIGERPGSHERVLGSRIIPFVKLISRNVGLFRRLTRAILPNKGTKTRSRFKSALGSSAGECSAAHILVPLSPRPRLGSGTPLLGLRHAPPRTAGSFDRLHDEPRGGLRLKGSGIARNGWGVFGSRPHPRGYRRAPQKAGCDAWCGQSLAAAAGDPEGSLENRRK
jgi:hypothetical protein